MQNLLALRFGNALFEPLWRREWVESIQITIAEELGVEARGDFYDNTGALRDMVQNHLLQLLSIVRWNRRIPWIPTPYGTKSCACCARLNPSIRATSARLPCAASIMRA